MTSSYLVSYLAFRCHLLTNEKEINLRWIYQINVRKSIHSFQPRMDSTIKLKNERKLKLLTGHIKTLFHPGLWYSY